MKINSSKVSTFSSIKAKMYSKALAGWFSGQSLTKKASLNALSSGLDYVARLVVGFLINPVLLAGLGDFYYGVWQFLGRLIDYISPATGRPTQALKWTIAKDQASDDHHNKRLQVGKAVSVWFLFLPVIAILGGLLAWYSPELLDTTEEISPVIRLTAALLVANVTMVAVVEIPRSVLEGENLGYKRMGLSAALVFLGGGLMVLATYLDFGVGGVAASRVITTLLSGILFFQVVRAYVPWFGFAKPTLEGVRHYLGLSGWFIGWNLVMKLLTASDVLVLGIFDSAESVTNYTLSKYVPETIVSIIAIVVQGIIPGLGGVWGSGDLKKTAQIRNEIMTYTWFLVTVLGTTILMWNRSFIKLWVGTEYSAGYLPTLLIVLMIIQFVLIRNDAFIIDLSLELRKKVAIGLLSAITSIAIGAVLVSTFNMGIVGLCLGFIIGRSIMSVVYPRYVGKLLNISGSSQLGSIIRPAILTTLLFGIGLKVHQTWIVNTWIGLVFSVVVTQVIVILVALFAGLTTNQRTKIWSRTRHILKFASKE